MNNSESFDINHTATIKNKKILDFESSQKVNNNTKKYELINVVSETGDSIYTIPSINRLACIVGEGEEIYISLLEIRKIINEELDKRLGPSSLNNKNGN